MADKPTPPSIGQAGWGQPLLDYINYGIDEAESAVKLTGDQTIAGAKTFSSAPVVPDGAFTIAKVTGLTSVLANKADVANLPTWATISGKPAVIAAGADAAAARTAIGAGTSNLALGTTSSTAKAGDYQPTWTQVTSKPAVIAAGATAADARTAIGAGTSNLALGTTSSTAKAGDYQPTWAQVTSKPTTLSQTALVDNMKFPAVVAHRGGGALSWPEESREGLEAAYEGGFILEVDVRPLSDGTPVCCHDSTTTRTMTISGAVSSFTLAQWRTAKIKPSFVGADYGTPVTFEEVLDAYGGRRLITPETYDATTTTAMIGMIQARGLTRSILGQSFNYTICQQWVAAGIEAVYLFSSNTGPAQSWATIKAAGINYIGAPKDMSSTLVTAAKAAGLKVFMFTAYNKIEHDAIITAGADGVFSDDPWGTSDIVPVTQEMPPQTQHRPYGSFAYGTRATPGVYEGVALAVQPQFIYRPDLFKKAGVGFPAIPVGNDLGYNRSVRCGWAGKITRPVVISAVLNFLPQTGSTANMGFSISSSSDGLYHDNAFAGQNGFTFAFRRSGTIQGWRYVNGAAASSLGSAMVGPTSSDLFPDNTAGTAKLTVVITATDITMIGEAKGYRTSITTADTTALVNANFFLRYSAAAGSISDIQITPITSDDVFVAMPAEKMPPAYVTLATALTAKTTTTVEDVGLGASISNPSANDYYLVTTVFDVTKNSASSADAIFVGRLDVGGVEQGPQALLKISPSMRGTCSQTYLLTGLTATTFVKMRCSISTPGTGGNFTVAALHTTLTIVQVAS